MELVAALIILVGVLVGTPSEPWQSEHLTDHPLVGQIVVVDSGQPLSQEDLVERMAAADYVILGEKHNNLDHHRLQGQLIRALAAAGQNKTAVVFEQLRHDQTMAVTAASSAEALRQSLPWDKQGWGPWARYQPVFEAAYETGAEVRPGDLARSRIRQVVRQGYTALPGPFRVRAKLEHVLSQAQQDALAEEIFVSHCKMMPKAMTGGMVKAQVARDAALADSMIRAKAGAGQVILIAGNGHAQTDRAVPRHLLHRMKDAKVFTLGLVEVSAQQQDLAAILKDKPPFDALWFTPAADLSDPCAAFKSKS